MHRRLDLHPLRRLRNPGRHLRSLAKWAAQADVGLPANEMLESWQGGYWNGKAPIYGKLVAEAHATPAIRAAVAQSMLDAAATISRRLVLDRPARVACLLMPESLFWSVVTIFFDDAYFRTFLPPAEYGTARSGDFSTTTEPATMDLVADWGLRVPPGFRDFGGYLMTERDAGDPEGTHAGHRWVFAEAGFSGQRLGVR